MANTCVFQVIDIFFGFLLNIIHRIEIIVDWFSKITTTSPRFFTILIQVGIM